MNLEQVEYCIFGLIVIAQIYSFANTRKNIYEFNNSVADINSIRIVEVSLSQAQINNFSSTDDIFDIPKNERHTADDVIEEEMISTDIQQEEKQFSKVRLVESTSSGSTVFNDILNSLNKYLLRNRHSVADFSLIKDIVERNTDTVEEEVNLTISTPLYLGLMGTMLGVVIGIFSMSDFIGAEVKEDSLTMGIAVLLASVKIAMMASFIGLLLTIYNSAITFKSSKYKLEHKKNRFYTLIQVELLPSLNQGMSATFDSLQRNLFSFNQKFDSNLERLSVVFDKNYDSIIMQKKMLEQMDSSKVADISKYNLRVLKELNISLSAFDKFNTMFANVNTYLANSYKLTEQSNELLDRTGNFEKIAATIESNISDSNQLINFLSAHFADLEGHKNKVDEAVISVGFSVKDTFEQLKASLSKSSELLGEEAINRNLESRKLFDEFSSELRTSFTMQAETVKAIMEEKKSSLDHLKHLETLLSEVRALRGGDQVGDQLASQINQLQMSIFATNETLVRIEQDAKRPLFTRIFKQK